jgi:hypothetical protein
VTRLASSIALVLAAVGITAGASPTRARAAGAIAHGTSPTRAHAAGAIAHGTSPTRARAAGAIAHGTSRAQALAAPERGIMRAQVSLGGVVCKGIGWLSGIAGTACTVATHPKTVITVGKKLLSGNPGGAVKAVLGTSSGAGRAVAAAAGLAAVVAWVTGGAHAALQETAELIDTSSRPNLLGTWFSAAYWRVAAVSALLTLPFLFAAAIQALLRSDVTLLARAAFGYLPLGMLAVGVAAPMTMLLLGASDEMSTIVSSASGNADGSFLAHAGLAAGAIGGSALSPFVAFFVALLTVAATITLWLELLVREAAVYVIVLMLPLFFAALVWPARRVWAIRAVELLVALILSKFAIVAVLALGGAALDHAAALSVTSLLAGLTLVLLAAFSPWALLRLLPLHELASAAASGMRHVPIQHLSAVHQGSQALGDAAVDFVGALPSRLQELTQTARTGAAPDRPALPPSQPDGASEPISEEHLEAAAEEAATAVAGGDAGFVGSPSSPPAPTTPATPAPATTPEGGTARVGDGHLTAPWLQGMRPIWHSDWRHQEFKPDADMDTPVAEIGDPPGTPGARPDADPPTFPLPENDAPTLPQQQPRPPATQQPDEDKP